MPSFFTGSFAIAGMIAAAAPVLIHFLNRRRFRVVPWAAMDFLREASRRSRRFLRLRDLLLWIGCVALAYAGFGHQIDDARHLHVAGWIFAAAEDLADEHDLSLD